jgi:hypothetical protein
MTPIISQTREMAIHLVKTGSIPVISRVTLRTFEGVIRATSATAHKSPLWIRPFVCRPRHGAKYGNPLTCGIFIIGTNPATQMTRNFWSRFWAPGLGFDYTAWQAAYSKTTGGTCSPTRLNIDAIIHEVQATTACGVLETNLYPYETPFRTKVPSLHRKTDVLEKLLQYIRPEVIVVHGAKACRWVSAKRSSSPVSSAILLPSPHLSNKNLKWFATSLGQEAARNC